MSWDWGGATGGAASGAATGSQVLPGWGTAIGAIGGGVLGGLFGGKKKAAAPNFSNDYSTPWASLTGGNLTLNPTAQGALSNIQSNMLKASQYDPTQARDQAVNQNMNYGMSLLNPQFQQQNTAFNSGRINTGATPEQQLMENTMLGQRQAGMLGNVFTNALNMGNQTQQTQMDQMNQPFNQYASLIGSSLQAPRSQLPAQIAQYGAQRNADAANQGAQSSLFGGIAGSGDWLGGLSKMFGGGGGAAANPFDTGGFNPSYGLYNF
jgi:hypothetical protein